jgi:hypothetical protein
MIVSKIYYLHVINPPWQPAALLKVPTPMSMSFSHSNSSAAPPPFSPQTNVPWALTKQNANRTQINTKICKNLFERR